MSAAELTAAQAVKVAAFGLDEAERPLVRLAAAIELLSLEPDTERRAAILAILESTCARIKSAVATGGIERVVWSTERDGIALADAILDGGAA
ncbi:hypothetical protein [Homoserinibacter sp. GY 40078]|uniref:hypothetical protein n=1 Tax=Homoserinibacter sp. GY 40078 TaxID=2603275 RepID=UPI0011C99551|nr:hypothetical protein [Homoserinibacter sp. GY 40078]TXK17381.1 hypothetical protein FVQ89_11140 [Homoserinibacter sp. GY 40078]